LPCQAFFDFLPLKICVSDDINKGFDMLDKHSLSMLQPAFGKVVSVAHEGRTYFVHNAKIDTTLEDANIDFKAYNLNNADNFYHLTRLISAFMNKHRFDDETLAGMVWIGIEDSERKVVGVRMRTNEIEHWNEKFQAHISQNTVPDIHSQLKISIHEVVYIDRITNSYVKLNDASEKRFVIEIKVLRKQDDTLVMTLQ
jgi:predicted HTH transcriptional regulator